MTLKNVASLDKMMLKICCIPWGMIAGYAKIYENAGECE